MTKHINVGDALHGFTIEKIEDVPEIEGRAYIMRHAKSGARLVFLQNEDINKAFSITFKTPPNNNTGVFHILEHSVLCGSEKFPVKEPFVNLIKNSMQTFLNAMTFSDKTMFPVASTNSQDLKNLIDVYMDAVLHPAIYGKKHIFEQEGWHIEADGASCESKPRLTYNGVVYNEMKGALSDPDSVIYDAICSQLFPDTAYGFESGGDPREIPDLTYESFLDTHTRHYNLSNSYIVLYGNLDISDFLEFLDDRYLSTSPEVQKKATAPNPLLAQSPTTNLNKTVEMHTTQDNACAALGYVVGDIHDTLRTFATNILIEAIAGCNEAPLKRALLDANLGQDVMFHVQDGVLQPFVFVEAQGLKQYNNKCDQTNEKMPHKPTVCLQQTIEREVKKLVDNGIDRHLLRATLAHEKFALREGNFGYADGVAYAISCMEGWLYSDDLCTAYLRYEDAFNKMEELLETNYFEDLLASIFLDNSHMTSVELVPRNSDVLGDADIRLQKKGESITTSELENIKENTKALQEEQMREDAPEDLAKLPHLHIKDIEDAPCEPPYHLDNTDYGDVLLHSVKTRGIVYAQQLYNLDGFAAGDLPYIKLMTSMLTGLDTQDHSATELVSLLRGNIGSLEYHMRFYKDANDAEKFYPKLCVEASALAENAAKLASLTNEISLKTKFEDKSKIKTMVEQIKLALEQNFCMNGQKAAIKRASAQQGAAEAAAEIAGGVEYYLFLCDLYENFDEKIDEVCKKFLSLTKTIFLCSECFTSFAGSGEQCNIYMEEFNKSRQNALGIFDQVEPVELTGLHICALKKKNEAFIVPSDVTFTGYAFNPFKSDVQNSSADKQKCVNDAACAQTAENAQDIDTQTDRPQIEPNNQNHPHFNGSWLIASRALTYGYLWTEVRVKGGAYGVAASFPNIGCSRFNSYRDPNLDDTCERFESTGAWLEEFNPTPDECEGYVVSSVAGMDAPQKPRAVIKRQISQFVSGIDKDFRKRTRQEIIDSSIEDVRSVATLASDCAHLGSCCVFGSAEIINNSKRNWSVTELIK